MGIGSGCFLFLPSLPPASFTCTPLSTNLAKSTADCLLAMAPAQVSKMRRLSLVTKSTGARIHRKKKKKKKREREGFE